MSHVYILEFPFLSSYGTYNFRRSSSEEVKDILTNNTFRSAIKHKEAAAFITERIGVEVKPVKTISVVMEPGDKGIMMRIRLNKLPDGKGIDVEFGIIERLGDSKHE